MCCYMSCMRRSALRFSHRHCRALFFYQLAVSAPISAFLRVCPPCQSQRADLRSAPLVRRSGAGPGVRRARAGRHPSRLPERDARRLRPRPVGTAEDARGEPDAARQPRTETAGRQPGGQQPHHHPGETPRR